MYCLFNDLVIITINKTRQGYAPRSTLKPAGYFFLGAAMGFEKPPKSFDEQTASSPRSPLENLIAGY